jgi:hypothetical protein
MMVAMSEGEAYELAWDGVPEAVERRSPRSSG